MYIPHKYRWIFAASLFFILWKFFLIGTLWHNRAIPPEPDDTYEYIAHIASISTCTSKIACPYPGVSFSDHSGFSYLSYRLFFGGIGRVFGISPEETLYFGFFLGTLFLIPALILFLQSLTNNRSLIAWSILFLAFYHGTGETHGFFWVVPSFFSALLFFLLFSLISNKNSSSFLRFAIYAGITSIIFVFSHPISIYLICILPIFVVFFFVFSRHINREMIQKTILVIAISLLASFGQEYYLTQEFQTNYYGITQSAQQTKENIESILFPNTTSKHVSTTYISGYSITKALDVGFFQQRLETMKVAYFRYIIPHWIALFPLLTLFWILLKKKEYTIVSLYIASLLFFVFATIFHEFGFRSALILWPITFIFVAFASWHGLFLLREIKHRTSRRILLLVLSTGIMIFFTVNALFALVFNLNANARNRYALDENFSKYLLKKTDQKDTLNLSPVLVRTTGGSKLYFRNTFVPLSQNPEYFALIDPSSEEPNTKKNSRFHSLARPIAKIFGISLQESPVSKSPEIPGGYTLDKEFGVIKVYRKTP